MGSAPLATSLARSLTHGGQLPPAQPASWPEARPPEAPAGVGGVGWGSLAANAHMCLMMSQELEEWALAACAWRWRPAAPPPATTTTTRPGPRLGQGGAFNSSGAQA